MSYVEVDILLKYWKGCILDFSRRLFLGSLVGGAALSVAGASLAMPSNRYQILIEMQKTLYADNALARAVLNSGDGVGYYNLIGAPNGVKNQFNALLDYLEREFSNTDLKNPAILRATQEVLFCRDEQDPINVLSEQRLSEVEDAVVSIAVFRHAYHNEKVFIPHEQDSEGYRAWNARYRLVRQPIRRFDPGAMRGDTSGSTWDFS